MVFVPVMIVLKSYPCVNVSSVNQPLNAYPFDTGIDGFAALSPLTIYCVAGISVILAIFG